MPNSLETTDFDADSNNKTALIATAIDEIANAVNEQANVDVSAGNVLVTSGVYLRNTLLTVINATVAGREVTLPQKKRALMIRSAAANTQTVALKLGTTTITLAIDSTYYIITDGTANGLIAILVSAAAATVRFYHQVAVSDETTVLTTGANKLSFRAPHAATNLTVRGSVNVAQAAGSILTFDINKNGATVLSTKLTIDNTETTSATAATPAVMSDNTWAADDLITIDTDQIGTPLAAGAKILFSGLRPV